MPARDYLRCVTNWHKIPDMRKEIANIKKHLDLEEKE
jgi:hypothetical protein